MRPFVAALVCILSGIIGPLLEQIGIGAPVLYWAIGFLAGGLAAPFLWGQS
jgi:hypothetical protein